jgi:histidine triad (HIT) family protein
MIEDLQKDELLQRSLVNVTIQDCAFCKIVRSEAQSYNIFEDDTTLAFLDRRPLFPGHSLLIPKSHYETLIDLPASLVAPLFQNAQLLARAMEQGLQAEGTFVAINNRISQSVPHLHIHIVPRHKKDGLKGFFWPRQHYQHEAAILAIQTTLRYTIAQLTSENQT